MKEIPLIEQIDPLNFAVVRLQLLFDTTELGPATGFFYRGILDNKPNYWLVTNWHVLAGRNADDAKQIMHSQGALPNRVRLSLIIKSAGPEYTAHPPGQILLQEQLMELYDPRGQAFWYQHQRKNDLDIAVINTGGAFDRFQIIGVNEVPTQNDMAIQIGNEVFILGYPLGFRHFMETPIWKRGSIASEPTMETPDQRTRVVIDATTRQGMSGGPVVMRAKTHYVSETGKIKRHVNATRWIGIYSSRPNLPRVGSDIEDDRRAEIGYFFKMRCVHDTIVSGIRGPNYGEMP
jgi:hypothetical protein